MLNLFANARSWASFIVLLALVVTPAWAGQLASLTVRVERVSPRGGDIRLALYDEASWPNDDADPVADIVVPAVSPETIATFKRVKPGVYGLKLFQDENRNGRFDFTWLGLPAERYGFSNDAHPIFSEPGFSRARFKLPAGANTITVHLQ
jgi:uncharacterized protein (DUF2141 family)